MSLELCVLGSGSAGNCSVLRTPGGAVLIDAGLGPRVTESRLKGTGLKLDDVRAICLTHLDHDHFNGNWIPTICRRDIRVFVNSHRLNDLLRTTLVDEFRRACSRAFKNLIDTFGTSKPFQPIDGLNFRALKLAHDRHGSHGFVIEGFGARIGYATDLGHVPDVLVDHFHDVDLLALESNYDADMQVNSARPWFLKRRIMGGKGHLSNEQAFDAIRAILDRAQRRRGCLPSHIVLLHRSRQCNCPRVLRNLFLQDPRVARRLTLSDQHRRTGWLRLEGVKPRSGEQLMLEWA
jgi:phosphoribosyl 1,2-cyclic phosphodiesterase